MALRATKSDENPRAVGLESRLHLNNWSHLVKKVAGAVDVLRPLVCLIRNLQLNQSMYVAEPEGEAQYETVLKKSERVPAGGAGGER